MKRANSGYCLQVTDPMTKTETNMFLATLDPMEVDEVKVVSYQIDHMNQVRYIVVYSERKPVDGIPVDDPTDSDPKPAATPAQDFADNLDKIQEAFRTSLDNYPESRPRRDLSRPPTARRQVWTSAKEPHFIDAHRRSDRG